MHIKTMSEMFPLDKEASRSRQGAKVLAGLLSKFKNGGAGEKAMGQFRYLSHNASAVERGAAAGKGVHMMNRPGKVLDKSKMKFLSKGQRDRAESVVAQHGLEKWTGNTEAGRAFKKVREQELDTMRSKVPAKANRKAFFSKGTPAAKGPIRIKNHYINQNTRVALRKTAEEIDQNVVDRINALSTPEGNARDKAFKGALMGALSGVALGLAHGQRLTAQIPLALGAAVPGAMIGGGIGGAVGYVGRVLTPLTAREKMRLYDEATSPIV
jgi:hypothetical protein